MVGPRFLVRRRSSGKTPVLTALPAVTGSGRATGIRAVRQPHRGTKRLLWPSPIWLLMTSLACHDSSFDDEGSPSDEGSMASNDDLDSGDGDGDGDGDSDSPSSSNDPSNSTGDGDGDTSSSDCSETPTGRRALRALTRRELARTLTDLLHIDVATTDVQAMPVDPLVEGWENDASATVLTTRHLDTWLGLSRTLVTRALDEASDQLLPCTTQDSMCAESFVESFGPRALRRPLKAEEIAHYAGFFADDITGGDFNTGVALSIRAMLMSSSFLYRSELGIATGEDRHELTAHERASALSYLFWGSMPDARLTQAALSGELDDADGLRAAAQRLLESPRGRVHLAEFSRQWLSTRSLLLANKDTAIYPSFTDQVREAMDEELARFVEHVVFESSARMPELFTADYLLANRALADFYGVQAPAGDDWAKISLDRDHPRGGLLGMGAILASHAHSDASSPILRGLFVRERLMCQTIPGPDASIDTTPPGLDPSLTTRERFRKHTDNVQCQACHQYIDGVGFGFEGFDGVGGYRLLENGLPVDESGEVVGLETLDDGRREGFDGPRQLSAILADSPNVQNCLPRQWYRYATGHEVGAPEQCSTQELSRRFNAADLDMKTMLLDLVTLPGFILREDRSDRSAQQ